MGSSVIVCCFYHEGSKIFECICDFTWKNYKHSYHTLKPSNILKCGCLSALQPRNYLRTPIMIGNKRGSKAKETWKRTLYWSHMRSVWYWVKRSGYTPNGMMMIARRASKPGSETKSRKKRFKFEMWRLTLNCSLPMLSSIVLFARD